MISFFIKRTCKPFLQVEQEVITLNGYDLVITEFGHNIFLGTRKTKTGRTFYRLLMKTLNNNNKYYGVLVDNFDMLTEIKHKHIKVCRDAKNV